MVHRLAHDYILNFGKGGKKDQGKKNVKENQPSVKKNNVNNIPLETFSKNL